MTKTDQKQTEGGVIAKFKAYRQAHDGEASFTLPETGVVVTFPEFRKHGQWMQAMRLAKNNIGKAQAMYICSVAKFDGEKITLTDFSAYVPMNDANDLLGEIFGDSDDEDEDFLGKGKTAQN